jgi:hypothetical protein
MAEITVRGVVRGTPFGGMSKSAHTALEINTPTGAYLFRIIGENPFEMSQTHQDLNGKTVRASGFLEGKTLLVRDYVVE